MVYLINENGVWEAAEKLDLGPPAMRYESFYNWDRQNQFADIKMEDSPTGSDSEFDAENLQPAVKDVAVQAFHSADRSDLVLGEAQNSRSADPRSDISSNRMEAFSLADIPAATSEFDVVNLQPAVRDVANRTALVRVQAFHHADGSDLVLEEAQNSRSADPRSDVSSNRMEAFSLADTPAATSPLQRGESANGLPPSPRGPAQAAFSLGENEIARHQEPKTQACECCVIA